MPEKMSEKEKMLAGQLCMSSDPELSAERRKAKGLCARYNQNLADLDTSILQTLFGSPTDAHIEPPFFCDYGYNIRIGQKLFANHNLVILDCALVTLGDNVLIGPNVVISAATHPTDPALRASGLDYAQPITIGNNVWIGASVTILPGVTIGDNVTVGAGSVVTRSLPANCVAAGNPCRIIREV